MDTKDDGGPAFPRPPFDVNDYRGDGSEGMSLRAYIATAVLSDMRDLNPLLPGESRYDLHWPDDSRVLADRRAAWAVIQADALIAALKGGAA